MSKSIPYSPLRKFIFKSLSFLAQLLVLAVLVLLPSPALAQQGPPPCTAELLQMEAECEPCYGPGETIIPCLEPTPLPSPSPSSSPTASPQPGKRTRLGYDIRCERDSFEATLDAYDNNQPIKDVKVEFEYNGDTRQHQTNKDGRAHTHFSKQGDGTLEANVIDFPDQSVHVSVPTDCDYSDATPSASQEVTQLAFTGGGDVLLLVFGVLIGVGAWFYLLWMGVSRS